MALTFIRDLNITGNGMFGLGWPEVSVIVIVILIFVPRKFRSWAVLW